MAKKRSKLLTLVAIGAAAAGTYYYLKKKNDEIPVNMDDDEDLDNFDEDVDDGPATKAGKRSYVSLDFNTVGEKIAESAEKAKAVVTETITNVAGKVEEFFDDRKPAENDSVPTAEPDFEEPSEEDYVETE